MSQLDSNINPLETDEVVTEEISEGTNNDTQEEGFFREEEEEQENVNPNPKRFCLDAESDKLQCLQNQINILTELITNNPYNQINEQNQPNLQFDSGNRILNFSDLSTEVDEKRTTRPALADHLRTLNRLQRFNSPDWNNLFQQLSNSFAQGSQLQKNFDQIMQLICGKRADCIENRRERLLTELPNKNIQTSTKRTSARRDPLPSTSNHQHHSQQY